MSVSSGYYRHGQAACEAGGTLARRPSNMRSLTSMTKSMFRLVLSTPAHCCPPCKGMLRSPNVS
eukprot:jgi/Botrbrau1/22005/Bobra.0024s0021.1